jgi:hypothetical protein
MAKLEEIDIIKILTEQQFYLETEVTSLALELSKIQEKYIQASNAYEKKKAELERFQSDVFPKISVICFTPGKTEYYRASYRHFNPIIGKSVPRVVHLGPSKKFKGKQDPELLSLAREKVLSYLMKKFPSIYTDLIPKK